MWGHCGQSCAQRTWGNVINGGTPTIGICIARLRARREEGGSVQKLGNEREREREREREQDGVKQEEARGVPQRAGITVDTHSALTVSETFAQMDLLVSPSCLVVLTTDPFSGVDH